MLLQPATYTLARDSRIFRVVRRLNLVYVPNPGSLPPAFLPFRMSPRLPPSRLSIMRLDSGAAMTIEEKVLEKLRDLSPEQKDEVLHLVETLREKKVSAQPLRSLRGLWADLNFEITEEDIAEARREMWGNFPRDIS